MSEKLNEFRERWNMGDFKFVPELLDIIEKYELTKTVQDGEMKQEIEGWIGGQYEDYGLYDNKTDADRGIMPSRKFYEAISPKFDGKKAKITIEEIK